MTTMNISLPDEMKAFIEAQAAQESYASVSEYLRTLIGDAQQRQAQHALEEPRDTTLEEESSRPMAARPLPKNALTEDEFQQHLLEIGLVSQRPVAPGQDADDEEDAPITITGEPLSETVLRERR